MSGFQDRSTGSEGNGKAADYIYQYFESLGLAPHDYYFTIPVRKAGVTSILFDNKSSVLTPFFQ